LHRWRFGRDTSSPWQVFELILAPYPTFSKSAVLVYGVPLQMKQNRPLVTALTLFAGLAFGSDAAALNGFFAGKAGPIKSHTTQVVVMKKADMTAVTVMPDYEGPLEGFAIVLLVPADVGPERVVTLKREFVDRLDALSAPRFHEFWEQDPCEPGPPQQEWERVLKVEGGGFLGGGAITNNKKVAKELFLDLEAKKKQGEYSFTVLDAGQDPVGWLSAKGYKAPDGAAAAIKPYLGAGYRPVVAEVDPKRIELIGADRAQLSPIRYVTEQPFDTLITKPGQLNSPGKQELVVYVIDPDARYEAKNYKNMYPPTNVEVDFVVKERMGEFYNAMMDIIAAKHPNTFLNEFAWPASGCGQPCATEPIMIHELLSLGADAFEQKLPEEERNPKPPELSKEEKEAQAAELKALKPKERKQRQKQIKEERQTIASRKALLERHKYVISRLHYRHDAASLPDDPKIGAASDRVEGGVAIPEGIKHEVTAAVKTAPVNRFQTRYNNFHPWVPKINCQQAERGRWGKSPPDYRGLRKTWIAEDLARKSRTQIKPEKVMLTEIADLGLGVAKAAAPAADAGPGDAGTAGTASSEKCGCRVPGGEKNDRGLLLPALVGLLAAIRFRRRARG
jgi:hypothetical protein